MMSNPVERARRVLARAKVAQVLIGVVNRLRRRAPRQREVFDDYAVAETCARICEMRASSLMRRENYHDRIPRIAEGCEAMKCASAIRALWREELSEVREASSS